MPTENRSTNTEMVSELLPCPFCGQQDFLIERLDSDASVVICQGLTGPHEACLARGPVGVAQNEGEEQPGRDKAVELWNSRAQQHQGEPVLWRYRKTPARGWFYSVHKRSAEIALRDGYIVEEFYAHADPGDVDRLRTMFDQTDADLRSVTADRVTLRAEADRLRQEVASIDKKLRGNVSDPDPLKPIMPGALSITTTYGLVAGIVRERDQLKKALERQP